MQLHWEGIPEMPAEDRAVRHGGTAPADPNCQAQRGAPCGDKAAGRCPPPAVGTRLPRSMLAAMTVDKAGSLAEPQAVVHGVKEARGSLLFGAALFCVA